MGILVISGDFWAQVGHEKGSAHLLESVLSDTKAVLLIDTPSNPRQLPIASQTYTLQ